MLFVDLFVCLVLLQCFGFGFGYHVSQQEERHGLHRQVSAAFPPRSSLPVCTSPCSVLYFRQREAPNDHHTFLVTPVSTSGAPSASLYTRLRHIFCFPFFLFFVFHFSYFLPCSSVTEPASVEDTDKQQRQPHYAR